MLNNALMINTAKNTLMRNNTTTTFSIDIILNISKVTYL